jgi:hypothetical protein
MEVRQRRESISQLQETDILVRNLGLLTLHPSERILDPELHEIGCSHKEAPK